MKKEPYFKQKIAKNTRKKYKKLERKSKKNTHMTGGKPKVSFPYVYFIVSYDNFKKYYNELNPYLSIQTNACDNISLGALPEVKYDEKIPFLSDKSEFCILVLKYNDAFNLNKKLDLFNDIGFLNKILGHAKLKLYPSRSLLGIYNVCLHPFIINKDQQGKFITEDKQLEPGYGSVLFNCIKTSISFLQLQFDTLWLGIDVNNVNFKKVAWLYASKGFEDPIFSNISPDGKELSIYFIQLTSKKTSYINNRDDALIPYYEIIDLHRQINTDLGKEGIFKLKFCFDKSAILTLRILPFYSFSENKQTIGIDDFNLQRETAGRFLTYKSYEDNGDIVNKLSLEILSESSMLKYEIGEKSHVIGIEGQKVFHTHPFINYKINNTLIGPPSSADLNTLNEFIKNGTQTPMSKIQQFAAVIAIEGIYIYSFSINGIRNLKNGRILTPNDINNYDYPFNERKYDWSTYANDNTIDQDAVKNEINKYFNWFEVVNKRFDDYFKIDFKPWNEINDNTQFEIHYYNGNRKLVKNPEDMDIIEANDLVIEKPDNPPPFKKQRINGGKKNK